MVRLDEIFAVMNNVDYDVSNMENFLIPLSQQPD
jgi:hypothetical protein